MVHEDAVRKGGASDGGPALLAVKEAPVEAKVSAGDGHCVIREFASKEKGDHAHSCDVALEHAVLEPEQACGPAALEPDSLAQISEDPMGNVHWHAGRQMGRYVQGGSSSAHR